MTHPVLRSLSFLFSVVSVLLALSLPYTVSGVKLTVGSSYLQVEEAHKKPSRVIKVLQDFLSTKSLLDSALKQSRNNLDSVDKVCSKYETKENRLLYELRKNCDDLNSKLPHANTHASFSDLWGKLDTKDFGVNMIADLLDVAVNASDNVCATSKQKTSGRTVVKGTADSGHVYDIEANKVINEILGDVFKLHEQISSNNTRHTAAMCKGHKERIKNHISVFDIAKKNLMRASQKILRNLHLYAEYDHYSKIPLKRDIIQNHTAEYFDSLAASTFAMLRKNSTSAFLSKVQHAERKISKRIDECDAMLSNKVEDVEMLKVAYESSKLFCDSREKRAREMRECISKSSDGSDSATPGELNSVRLATFTAQSEAAKRAVLSKLKVFWSHRNEYKNSALNFKKSVENAKNVAKDALDMLNEQIPSGASESFLQFPSVDISTSNTVQSVSCDTMFSKRESSLSEEEYRTSQKGMFVVNERLIAASRSLLAAQMECHDVDAHMKVVDLADKILSSSLVGEREKVHSTSQHLNYVTEKLSREEAEVSNVKENSTWSRGMALLKAILAPAPTASALVETKFLQTEETPGNTAQNNHAQALSTLNDIAENAWKSLSVEMGKMHKGLLEVKMLQSLNHEAKVANLNTRISKVKALLTNLQALWKRAKGGSGADTRNIAENAAIAEVQKQNMAAYHKDIQNAKSRDDILRSFAAGLGPESRDVTSPDMGKILSMRKNLRQEIMRSEPDQQDLHKSDKLIKDSNIEKLMATSGEIFDKKLDQALRKADDVDSLEKNQKSIAKEVDKLKSSAFCDSSCVKEIISRLKNANDTIKYIRENFNKNVKIDTEEKTHIYEHNKKLMEIVESQSRNISSTAKILNKINSQIYSLANAVHRLEDASAGYATARQRNGASESHLASQIEAAKSNEVQDDNSTDAGPTGEETDLVHSSGATGVNSLASMATGGTGPVGMQARLSNLIKSAGPYAGAKLGGALKGLHKFASNGVFLQQTDSPDKAGYLSAYENMNKKRIDVARSYDNIHKELSKVQKLEGERMRAKQMQEDEKKYKLRVTSWLNERNQNIIHARRIFSLTHSNYSLRLASSWGSSLDNLLAISKKNIKENADKLSSFKKDIASKAKAVTGSVGALHKAKMDIMLANVKLAQEITKWAADMVNKAKQDLATESTVLQSKAKVLYGAIQRIVASSTPGNSNPSLSNSSELANVTSSNNSHVSSHSIGPELPAASLDLTVGLGPKVETNIKDRGALGASEENVTLSEPTADELSTLIKSLDGVIREALKRSQALEQNLFAKKLAVTQTFDAVDGATENGENDGKVGELAIKLMKARKEYKVSLAAANKQIAFLHNAQDVLVEKKKVTNAEQNIHDREVALRYAKVKEEKAKEAVKELQNKNDETVSSLLQQDSIEHASLDSTEDKNDISPFDDDNDDDGEGLNVTYASIPQLPFPSVSLPALQTMGTAKSSLGSVKELLTAMIKKDTNSANAIIQDQLGETAQQNLAKVLEVSRAIKEGLGKAHPHVHSFAKSLKDQASKAKEMYDDAQTFRTKSESISAVAADKSARLLQMQNEVSKAADEHAIKNKWGEKKVQKETADTEALMRDMQSIAKDSQMAKYNAKKAAEKSGIALEVEKSSEKFMAKRVSDAAQFHSVANRMGSTLDHVNGYVSDARSWSDKTAVAQAEERRMQNDERDASRIKNGIRSVLATEVANKDITDCMEGCKKNLRKSRKGDRADAQ